MYPLPFSPSFPKKLPKILVGVQFFSSFFLISANTICETFSFANPVVFSITSCIWWAVTATGFSGE